MRTATITRNTKETQVTLHVNLDGNGSPEISTGLGFFDHMLTLFAAHSMIDVSVDAKGDLYVDGHHTVEDVGIALGQAFAAALGDKRGIRRYGHFTLPMDETLVSTAVDFSGRPCLVYNIEFQCSKIGLFDTELIREFWQGFVNASACNLHVNLHYGDDIVRNGHHVAEAVFKSIARAVRMAVENDPRQQGIPSTKGTL